METETLVAHTYSIDVVDNHILTKTGKPHTEIRLWCFNPNSEVLLLRVF